MKRTTLPLKVEGFLHQGLIPDIFNNKAVGFGVIGTSVEFPPLSLSGREVGGLGGEELDVSMRKEESSNDSNPGMDV